MDKIKGEGEGGGGRWVWLGCGGGMGRKCRQLYFNNNKNLEKIWPIKKKIGGLKM